MHHVGTLAETAADAGAYQGHSKQYTRKPIVGRATGSVHQTLAVCELGPGGQIDSHVHAGEEALGTGIGS